jgi:hypothetical protein
LEDSNIIDGPLLLNIRLPFGVCLFLWGCAEGMLLGVKLCQCVSRNTTEIVGHERDYPLVKRTTDSSLIFSIISSNLSKKKLQ